MMDIKQFITNIKIAVEEIKKLQIMIALFEENQALKKENEQLKFQIQQFNIAKESHKQPPTQ